MEIGFDYHINRNIVNTTCGKLRGYKNNGVYSFLGVPYATAERFCAARRVEYWEGIRDALAYGPVAPLMGPMDMKEQLLIPHRMWNQSEECQNLNLWTPSISCEEGLPVVVWLHGGGYFEGSSIEQLAYEGESLAREENVVVISVNHRLNILGYLDLSGVSEKYNNSGNAGMTDLVEALRWIRENVKRFGGNPDNITLFGQSGGGDKIISLMQIPAAEGLFHRAIIQSGVLPIDNTLDVDLKNGNKVLAKLMMEKLGADINSLIQADYHDLVKVYLESKKECRIKGIPCTGNRPIPNDYYIGDPRIKEFSSFAKEIPVLCGTTYAEISFGEEIPDKNELLDNKVQQLLEEKFSKEGLEQILPIYKRLWPERKSIDLLYLDSMIRGETLSFMNAFSREAKCECYSYIFAPVFPYNGGKNAWHCSEIPFIFHNTDKVPVCNFKGAKDLENSMAEIWMNFARHGKPDGDGLDSWPPYEGSKGCTIIMSNSRMRLMDSDTELQELIRKYGKKPEFMIED